MPAQILNQFVAHLPTGTNLSNLYIFPEGAAECFSFVNGETNLEYSHLFTEDEAKHIIDSVNKVLDETKIVEGEPSYGDRVENRGGQITLSTLGQKAPVEAKRVWDPTKEKRQMLRKILVPMLPECEVKIGGMTSVDISKKGIDKRLSVQWIAKHLNVPLEEVLYVGDALFEGGNDEIVKETGVPTLQTSGPEETITIIEKYLH
jgi:hydroxymethylpyrimidine pyrophosphatase-like HAD family hydrolase